MNPETIPASFVATVHRGVGGEAQLLLGQRHRFKHMRLIAGSDIHQAYFPTRAERQFPLRVAQFQR